ncbi:SDR family oxidoreductase [Jiangella alba]|uniref:NAD(P)-dependent dehydrogenase, short-chain alcohol dehydrogenase family n=1 Tax=Jiangella alba TaxID=561176 RepID=A0A1H5P5R8_9ACTN|nr:SDR family oxidoreductase [Jiangella alba]SEF09226.1 NAD(P)-dependent dehydrogenase, short-chain alcohol dehydrogenase family [Jiangella alba]
MTLAGKRVAITGGSGGIGAAIAAEVVGRGGTVTLIGRTEARLKEAAADLGPRASYLVADVSDGAALDSALEQAGPLDHLVTAAAGGVAGPFADVPEDAVRDLFETKFWGQYRAVRAVLPRLPSDGSVLLFSGFLYRKPAVGLSAFAAVNGAIEGLVKALAVEAAPVRINALSPGRIDTLGGGEPMPDDARREYVAMAGREATLGRIGTAAEAAHGAVFLLESSYTTGVTLDVDGGLR